MRSLEITTVVGCEVDCEYCPQSKIVSAYQGGKVMDLDTFRMCLSTVPRDVSIVFSGMAEPFQNPKCCDMVLSIVEAHKIYMYTTTIGMTASDVGRLCAVPFQHFIIHVVEEAPQEIVKRCQLMLHNVSFNKMNWDIAHSRAGNLEGKPPINKRKPVKCDPTEGLMDHSVLLPNGDVVLCCMDWGLEHVIGNLLEDTYEDIQDRKAEAYDLCCRCNYAEEV